MTIKGKRVGALRKISPDETATVGAGGCIDESFPVDAVHAALDGMGVDLTGFNEYFAVRVGTYRMMNDANSSEPTFNQEMTLLAELVEYLSELRTRLDHLPPTVDAYLNEVCWFRHSEIFDSRHGRLDIELKELSTLLILTEQKLEPFKGQAGRKSKGSRNQLLYDVATWLRDRGAAAGASADAAARILQAVEIDAPDDPSETAKIIREHARRLNDGGNNSS